MRQSRAPPFLLQPVMALPHPVPVLEEIATGLLAPPRLREGLQISVTVCVPVHQQPRRNHCFPLNPVQEKVLFLFAFSLAAEIKLLKRRQPKEYLTPRISKAPLENEER